MHEKVLRPAYNGVVGGGIYVSSDLTNKIPQTRTVRKRRRLTLQLHCSLALFIHLYLSTSSGVAYSSMHHDGLVMFRMRQHYPITPSSINLHTPVCSSSRSRKRTSTGVPSSSQYTASHRNQPTFAPLLSLDGPKSPFLSTTSRAC